MRLCCREWNDEIVPMASALLLEEFPLPGGSPGGMEAFRCSLTVSFFFKFYLSVRLKLELRSVSCQSFRLRIFTTMESDEVKQHNVLS